MAITETVSGRIGFGGTALVGQTPDEAARLVSAAWDAGIRTFDTAPFYGHGLSEQRLGAALGDHLFRACLCTKVGVRIVPCDLFGTAHLRARWPANMPGYAAPAYEAAGIMATFEESLHRIGRHFIDIALLHGLTLFPDAAARDLVSAQRALHDLKETGKVRKIGAAVNSIETAMHLLDGWRPDVMLIAEELSICSTASAARFIDRCDSLGIEILAAAPFAGGALFKQTNTVLDRLYQEHGVSRLAAAIQYPMRASPVQAVVPTMSRPQRVTDTAKAAAQPIAQAFWQALDRTGLGPLAR
ncbi:aldo/keto reductase [Ruegeria marina]|uniref:D-threo-aldose 1-dehydrogenase n=1 Tax=Ruegeria marina TaxID=639004 RepID=A0A1G7FRG1_9RHOB|nr:aldo/keto reductase [Ruegeria marina]SDE78412.1 D-threo-aldose 1-dehydrogenase [Ruegeria marina]